jgi:small subunit ribosomal protein S7
MNSSKYIKTIITKKLISQVMISGKRSKAEKIVLTSLRQVEQTTNQNAFSVLLKALKNICPVMEVKSKRVGGGIFQVPFPLGKKKQMTLGISWLVNSAQKYSGQSMISCLTKEIVAASKGYGPSVRKRELQHQLAKRNRAFTHFRW